MAKSNKWIDIMGHEVKRGDFIAYGVGRAGMSFAVVKGIVDGKLKIAYPHLKTEGNYINGRYEITKQEWLPKNSTLHNADTVITPLNFGPEARANHDYMNAMQKLHHEINTTNG